MRIFLRLLTYTIGQRWRLTSALLLALVGVALELARPWPVKFALDAVVGARSPRQVDAVAGLLSRAASPGEVVTWSIVIAIVIVLASAVINLLVLRAIVEVAQSMVFRLSSVAFARLQRLSLAFHGRHTVGDLLQRMSQDVFVAHFAISQVAIPGLGALLTLVGMFVIMARLDSTLALIAAAVVPLLAVTLALFSKPMNRTTTTQYEVQGQLMALIEQSLSGIRAVQGYARERDVQRRVEQNALALGNAYNQSAMVQGYYKEATGIITGVAAAALLGVGGYRVLGGTLSPGDLFVFIGYLTSLSGPVLGLSTAVGAAVVVNARGRRVFEIVDSNEEVRESANPLAPEIVRGALEFDRVSFSYTRPEGGETEQVLSDISFRVEPGSITALVGATGAGKTSLVSMLSRFHDPSGGRITLDDKDLRDYALTSLRESVALVLQEPFLFPMSVADNIAFGRPGATRTEIEHAAMVAQADRFVRRLPDGYDTIIGEKGSTLSGGERQRISLARAVLKSAPILVLDEPTSALDARTEAKVFDALRPIIRGRTTLIISHRLSTIRHADRIVVLDQGRVVESGTHESLLEADGVYADLCQHQHVAVI